MKIQKETLINVASELSCWTFGDAEIDELVDPKLGVITGFNDLQQQLEKIRQFDLGETPPAGQIRQHKTKP